MPPADGGGRSAFPVRPSLASVTPARAAGGRHLHGHHHAGQMQDSPAPALLRAEATAVPGRMTGALGQLLGPLTSATGCFTADFATALNHAPGAVGAGLLPPAAHLWRERAGNPPPSGGGECAVCGEAEQGAPAGAAATGPYCDGVGIFPRKSGSNACLYALEAMKSGNMVITRCAGLCWCPALSNSQDVDFLRWARGISPPAIGP